MRYRKEYFVKECKILPPKSISWADYYLHKIVDLETHIVWRKVTEQEAKNLHITKGIFSYCKLIPDFTKESLRKEIELLETQLSRKKALLEKMKEILSNDR